MRFISQDLLDKIKKSQQTIYENANPVLKTLISKGFNKNLFQVFTIHDDTGLEGLDVSVRRMNLLEKPIRVYVVYMKNGVAHIKSKGLPYDVTLPWDYEFLIGAASEVATDFDGYWELFSGRWTLKTDEYPYIFKVVSGELFVQLWDGTPTSLATNVSKISAVRGWAPVNGDNTTDQGLIIAYVKTDGTVWYRTYAIQVSSSKTWESERQITEFTKTAVNISTFRTNDFRVGFVVQNSDSTVEFLVTTRNWAGMSVPAETIKLGSIAISNADFEAFEIKEYLYDLYPQDTIKMTGMDNSGVFNIYEVGVTPASITVLILDTGVLSSNSFYFKFNYDVYTWSPDFLISSITGIELTDVTIVGDTVICTTESELSALDELLGFSIIVGGMYFARVDTNRTEMYSGGSVTIKGSTTPRETILLDIAIDTANTSVDIYEIITQAWTVYPNDAIKMTSIEMTSGSFAITEIGTEPI